MSDKEPKKKTFKEYTVNRKSVGSGINWKGSPLVLNNGLPQSTLKAMFAHGIRSITKNIKE